MIELVTKPFVCAFALPRFDGVALGDFIREHGLLDLAGDDDTPIARLYDAATEGGHQQDADTLSEFAGRFCYRSWDKGRGHEEYIANIIEQRHGNVLAHANVSFIVTGVSRSLVNELIRHHVGTNPSQESQRYVTADGGEIEVVGFKATRAVVPPLILSVSDKAHLRMFTTQFEQALGHYYMWLTFLKERLPADMPATIKKKRAQEAARCFLPNACETRLVWTMNMRAARNIIEQRGDIHADLEIRRLAAAFTLELQRVAPATFFDAEVYTADDGFEAVRVAHSKV